MCWMFLYSLQKNSYFCFLYKVAKIIACITFVCAYYMSLFYECLKSPSILSSDKKYLYSPVFNRIKKEIGKESKYTSM